LEHSKKYYRGWTRFWDGINNRVERVKPWTRFRVSRLAKWVVALALLNAFVAWRTGQGYFEQLPNMPKDVIDYLFSSSSDIPLIFNIIFLLGINVMIFVAIFWFMSRGGMETYFPDDVKTRFSDVWGQDAVLEKIKENLIFLEDPKSIEDKGGHVPGGI